MPQPRLVILDPAHSSNVGHHDEVNRPLLAALQRAGWAAELWADVALEAEADAPHPLLGAFSGCGYVDPQQWRHLSGTLQLAKRLEQQLALASAAGPPVQAWLAHSLLPFQLLGLARHLTTAPPARLLISLMFAPAETLGGNGDAQLAIGNARVALAALARAVAQGDHQLQLAFPSLQQHTLYTPLLKATGLTGNGVHPAVVGAGCTPEPPEPGTPAKVLLHWGDRKPGKGRQEALAVLNQLLSEGPPAELQGWRWLFHCHSREGLPAREQEVLQRALEAELGLEWLQGPQSCAALVQQLAACPLALLAYDPELYGERSSGMLWHWAAARQALGHPAAAVGHATGWLAREAPQLGVNWSAPQRRDGWLEALAVAATQLNPGQGSTAYGQEVLGRSFAAWCAEQLADTRQQRQSEGT